MGKKVIITAEDTAEGVKITSVEEPFKTKLRRTFRSFLEKNNGVPVRVDIDRRRQPTLEETISMLIRSEVSRRADDAGFETFDEFNDFDEPDEFDDFTSQHEEKYPGQFDDVHQEYKQKKKKLDDEKQKKVKENRKKELQALLSEEEKTDGKPKPQ